MTEYEVLKKRSQNIYLIVICMLLALGLLCQNGVPWYQVVLSAFCFVTAGMLMTLFSYITDDDDDEEDREGY